MATGLENLDADMENTETLVWLKFSKACDYISEEKYEELAEITGRLEE